MGAQIPSWPNRRTLSYSSMSVLRCYRDSLKLTFYIQTETATVEFRNSRLERLMGLTAADRKWMDEIVRDVNDAWDDADPLKPAMQCVICQGCPILDSM